MMKRFVAIVLCAGLLLSLGAVPAAAATGDLFSGPAFNDISGDPAAEDLTILCSLGVFSGTQGPGGPVYPSNPITRQEYCKVVVEAFGWGDEATALGSITPDFADGSTVATWAWGYVNALYQHEVINGYAEADGTYTFRPTRNVTYAEAIAMLTRAANHDAQAAASGSGQWPNNYVMYGITKDFTGDVIISDPNGACTRGDMARMLVASMQVDPLDATGTPIAGGAILTEGDRLESDVTFNGRNTADPTTCYISSVPGPTALAETVYMFGGTSYSSCSGNKVTVIRDEDDEICFIKKLSGSTITGVFDELDSDVQGDYILLESGQKVYYTGNVHVDLNKDQTAMNDQSDLRPGDELTINVDGSGEATWITAWRWDLVDHVIVLLTLPPMYIPTPAEDYLADVTPGSGSTPTEITFSGATPFMYYDATAPAWTPLDDVTLEVGSPAEVTINGSAADPEDLAAEDVIKGATFGAKGYEDESSIIAVSATREVVDGVVEDNIETHTASGVTYSVELDVGGTTQTYVRNETYLIGELTLDQRYQLSLNEDGELFHQIAFDLTMMDVYVESCSGSPGNWDVTVDRRGTTETYDFGVGDPTSAVGGFIRMWYDEGTDCIIFALPIGVPVPGYEVLAVGSGGSSVTFGDGVDTFFVQDDDIIVYQKSGANYTYIGAAGLSAGDEISVFPAPAIGAVLIIYEP